MNRAYSFQERDTEEPAIKRCLSCNAAFDRPDWTCPACGFAPESDRHVPTFAPALSGVGDQYPPEVYERLARLEETFFWGLARNRLVGLALARFFPGAKTFFEAGCGTGQVLGHLADTRPGLALAGCDLHLQGLAVARRRAPRAELLQADVTNLPFREHFDVVAAFDVIEHLDHDAPAVAELSRALKPGGGLLLAVPQHAWLWSGWDAFSRHRRRYRRKNLATLVREAGLTPVWATSFLTLLLPALVAARLAERLPGAKPPTDPLDEMRLPGPLNALFAGVCALERELIRARVPLPVGGSLLMAAVKP